MSLTLTDIKNPALVTAGRAKVTDRPRIALRLSRGLAYPFKTHECDEVGLIEVRSFEEELVLVLAHELEHVAQFVEGRNTDRRQMEVGAEFMGLIALQDWRRVSL